MKSLIDRDLRHIWHPCSQMKDYESFQPISIERAEGSRLYLKDGTDIIDAISSWWCKSLGHGHPRLRSALQRQMTKFEHVILANTTNDTIVQLSEKLARLTPNLDKVFYGGDGSTAVEIAVKMSLQSRLLRGQFQKTRFAALENGYHGETVMTLALGDLGIYKSDYEALMPPVEMLHSLPYISGPNDPGFKSADAAWPAIETQLNRMKDNLTAIVLEPVLQGAGGMIIYSPDILRKLRHWTHENDVHLIADEIMTGFGRTGTALACDHAGIEPDFVCISKGLTAGWLAMSAVLTSTEMYNLFYDDYAKRKSFLHSNTFAGNALAAAVAVEALNEYEDKRIFEQVAKTHTEYRDRMQTLADETGILKNLRGIGALMAADLVLPADLETKRMGFELFQIAVKKGLLLRPLANTIYWLPPLNMNAVDREVLMERTRSALNAFKDQFLTTA